MVVSSFVRSFSQAVEAVKVELTLEGGELRLLEVRRHHLFGKLLVIVHDKAATVWLPRNNMGESIVFNLIEKLVQSEREYSSHTSFYGRR